MINRLVKVCGAISVNCGLHSSHSCDVSVFEFGSAVGYKCWRGETNEQDVSVLLTDQDWVLLAIRKPIISKYLLVSNE